jgi:PAS domain S-box-containing protein
VSRFYRLPLRHKILAGIVAVVAFMTLAMDLVAVDRVLMPRLEGELVRRSHTIARAVSIQAGELVITRDEPKLLSLLFEKLRLDPSLAYLIVTDAQGRLLAHTFVEGLPPGIMAAHGLPQGASADVRPVEIGGHSYYDMAHPIMEGIYRVGTVRVGLSHALVEDYRSGMELALWGVMAVIALAAIWASSWFTRQITRPLGDLTEAAEEVSRGNLGVRLALPQGQTGGRDEIEQLTVAFDHMVRQLRNSQEELRQAAEFRDNLLRSSPDAIVATDEAGRVALFNEGAQRLFGVAAAEVLGRPAGGLLSGLGAEMGRCERLTDHETAVRTHEGRLVQVSVSASCISDAGRTVGAVIILRDLTERKRLEEEMVRADKLAAVGKAVAYITHEIKNPLMVIGGLAKQVAARPAPSPEDRPKLEIVVKEIKRLEAFLLEIGEYTKTTRLETAPVAVPELLDEVLQLMQGTLEKRHIEVDSELPASLPPAEGDALKLKQVLINLVKNATDAMPQGGHLWISSRRINGRLEIRIKDSGPGIPPEMRADLFKPFFTTKPKGTGLGLTISRRIIEDHHGELRLESERGEGTEAVIVLPAAA